MNGETTDMEHVRVKEVDKGMISVERRRRKVWG